MKIWGQIIFSCVFGSYNTLEAVFKISFSVLRSRSYKMYVRLLFQVVWVQKVMFLIRINEGLISLIIGFSRLHDGENLFIIFLQYWGIHMSHLVQISGKYSNNLFSVPVILPRKIWVKQQCSQLSIFHKTCGWYTQSLCFSARFAVRK